MAQVTQSYIEEMGKTGARIRSEDEINLDQPNAFTNKWRTHKVWCHSLPVLTSHWKTVAIKETCPWFFEMRDLIAERPNLIPTGLGNSTTEIDLTSFTGDEDTQEDILAVSDSEDEAIAALTKREIESEGQSDDGKTLTKASKTNGTRGKTAARPSTSIPAATTKNPGKKKAKIEEFAEIAQVEEMTRQKELDVAKVQAERALAEVSTKAELKKERLRSAREKPVQSSTR
jgi:hypothetical protein